MSRTQDTCIISWYFMECNRACRTRAHACRDIEVGARGAQPRTAETPSTTLAATLVYTKNPRLTGPCLAQNAKSPQTRREKGRARSTRGARRRLPDPTDALAHRNSPRAGPDLSHRRTGAVLHCRTVDFLKKARR